MVLDVGASIGADEHHLINLAAMGSAMARVLFDIERPTIGLLNVGVEEIKGLEQVREAGRLLREGNFPHLNYVGFVEGDDIGKGTVDVVVTEGFAGNIALKTAEGTARQFAQYLKNAMSRTWAARLGYLLSRQAFRTLRDKMDPRKSNGGVFLGLNGIVIKSHGGADAEGFASAIDMGYDMFRYELLAKIGESMARDMQASATARMASGADLVTVLRSVVLGCGSYLPARILSNDELAKSVETTDEWIVQRTGIRERHIAAARRTDLRPRAACRARGARQRPCRGRLDRPDRARHLDAGPDLSGHRRVGAGRPRHHAGRRLRSAGGLFGLRLCAVGGRLRCSKAAPSSARW